MGCFYAITEKNGEEKGSTYKEKGLLKIPKSYWMDVTASNPPNCCYISLDGRDKLSESLKTT